MKKLTIILLILLAVFFTSTLVLLYLNLNKNTPITLTDQIEVNPMETISPTIIPTDLTTDWKTYTNTKYGFSFKYPTSYKLNNLSLYDEKGEAIYTLNVSDNLKKLDFLNFEIDSLNQCLSNPPKSGEGCSSLFLENKILSRDVSESIDPVLGKIYFRKNAPYIVDIDITGWQKNDYIYTFNVKSDKYSPEYFQILSTFRFSDSNISFHQELLNRLNQKLNANLTYNVETIDGKAVKTLDLSDYYNPEFSKNGGKLDIIKQVLIDFSLVYNPKLDTSQMTMWEKSYQSAQLDCNLGGNEEFLWLKCF